MPDPILAAPPAAPPAGAAPPATPPATPPVTPPATPPATPPVAPPAAPPATPPVPTAYDLKPSKPDALPEAAVKQVAEIAKDLGLSQEAAQKLLARHEAGFAAHKAATEQARIKQSDAWHDQIAADKELGGANLSKTIDAARKGLSVLSDAERQAISDGGYQNHPILVKVLAKLGGFLGEGNLGGNPSAPSAKQLFPSMPNP